MDLRKKPRVFYLVLAIVRIIGRLNAAAMAPFPAVYVAQALYSMLFGSGGADILIPEGAAAVARLRLASADPFGRLVIRQDTLSVVAALGQESTEYDYVA